MYLLSLEYVAGMKLFVSLSMILLFVIFKQRFLENISKRDIPILFVLLADMSFYFLYEHDSSEIIGKVLLRVFYYGFVIVNFEYVGKSIFSRYSLYSFLYTGPYIYKIFYKLFYVQDLTVASLNELAVVFVLFFMFQAACRDYCSVQDNRLNTLSLGMLGICFSGISSKAVIVDLGVTNRFVSEVFWSISVIVLSISLLINKSENIKRVMDSSILPLVKYLVLVVATVPFFIMNFINPSIDTVFLSLITTFIGLLACLYVTYKISSIIEQVYGFLDEQTLSSKSVIKGLPLEMSMLIDKVVEYHRKNVLSKEIEKRMDQVAHDIKSPLTSLDYLFSKISSLVGDDVRSVGTWSLKRMHDLVNELSVKSMISENESGTSKETLVPLLKKIVSEKRINSIKKNNVEIVEEYDRELFAEFVEFNLVSFSRAISNIINNSIDAYDNRKGKLLIQVKAIDKKDKIIVEICDNGIGIEDDTLKRIFERGYSKNKASGQGLGLSQVKTFVDESLSKVHVISKKGFGTTVQIIFSKAKRAKWFKNSFSFYSTTSVVIIDDDSSIHKVWMSKIPKNINLMAFRSISEFENTKEISRNSYYLVDYDLRGGDTGLDFILKNNLQKISTLVTSYYYEPSVRRICNRHGIKILPKDCILDVPVNILSVDDEMVLIDDMREVRKTWELCGSDLGVKVSTFYDVDDFIKSKDRFDRNVRIYVDSNLSNGISGEFESKRIFDEGFTEIYLATASDEVFCPEWIKGKVSKEFPGFIDD